MPEESLDLMTQWTVVQAEACGVTGTKHTGEAWNARTLAQVAPGGYVRIVRPPSGVDPDRTLLFARGEVGTEYGFLTIASIAIELLPPRWLRAPVQFRADRTWICSALGMESVRFGGYYRRWGNLYEVRPAQAYHALTDSGGIEIPLSTARPGDVGFAHGVGIFSRLIEFAQRKTPDGELSHMFVLDRYQAAA